MPSAANSTLPCHQAAPRTSGSIVILARRPWWSLRWAARRGARVGGPSFDNVAAQLRARLTGRLAWTRAPSAAGAPATREGATDVHADERGVLQIRRGKESRAAARWHVRNWRPQQELSGSRVGSDSEQFTAVS